MQFSIVLMLVIVIDRTPLVFDHEQEHEHDYEVARNRRLPTFPARECRMASRRSAHLVLQWGNQISE
jgi:hypothetical protein